VGEGVLGERESYKWASITNNHRLSQCLMKAPPKARETDVLALPPGIL